MTTTAPSAPRYRVTQSTWDQSGRRTDTAVSGPVRDALEAIAAQALDLSPAIASVVFDSPDHHARITVFRPEPPIVVAS